MSDQVDPDSPDEQRVTDRQTDADDAPRQPDDTSDEADDDARQKSAEEFAREHDPEQHDLSAGEEFRQRGDWTADEAGGPQVFDADGNLVEDPDSTDQQQDSSGDRAQDARRTSSLDEIRDGGYGVGSAATIDDGAVPLGHPVKAWQDTKTFVSPGQQKYDEAEPHLWFADAYAAQRAGFRPID